MIHQPGVCVPLRALFLVYTAWIGQAVYFLNPNFNPLIIFCSCAVWFVSDRVRNPKDMFSYDEAHTSLLSGDDLESLLFHFMDVWLFIFSAEPFFIARVSKPENT